MAAVHRVLIKHDRGAVLSAPPSRHRRETTERDERDILLERTQTEGAIIDTGRGGLGIFDPQLALLVDNANTAALALRPAPIDGHLSPVPWRDVRAPLIEATRQQTSPALLEAMHFDMLSALAVGHGEPVDLALLAGKTATHALLPALVGPLSIRERAWLSKLQDHRLQRQIDSPFKPPNAIFEWRHRLRELRSGRRIARLVAERAAPPVRDRQPAVIDSLIAMRDRIGLTRVEYLTQTLLISASTAPAILAACILHTLTTRPDLRAAVAAEYEALPAGALYHQKNRRAMRTTTAFIAEALRLWTFPMLTGRTATARHEIDGRTIDEGAAYTLSAYILHRCPRHWCEPDAFDPSRWTSNPSTPARGTYVPFGFGARTCVAANLAEAQLYLLCALFACEFEPIEANPGQSRIITGTIPFPRNFVGRLALVA